MAYMAGLSLNLVHLADLSFVKSVSVVWLFYHFVGVVSISLV